MILNVCHMCFRHMKFQRCEKPPKKKGAWVSLLTRLKSYQCFLKVLQCFLSRTGVCVNPYPKISHFRLWEHAYFEKPLCWSPTADPELPRHTQTQPARRTREGAGDLDFDDYRHQNHSAAWERKEWTTSDAFTLNVAGPIPFQRIPHKIRLWVWLFSRPFVYSRGGKIFSWTPLILRQTITMLFCFICSRAQYGRLGMSALSKQSGERGEPVFGAFGHFHPWKHCWFLALN